MTQVRKVNKQEPATSRSSTTKESPVEIVFTPDNQENDVDALLDEIDGILEKNAQEFVSAYTQKSGE